MSWFLQVWNKIPVQPISDVDTVCALVGLFCKRVNIHSLWFGAIA